MTGYVYVVRVDRDGFLVFDTYILGAPLDWPPFVSSFLEGVVSARYAASKALPVTFECLCGDMRPRLRVVWA